MTSAIDDLVSETLERAKHLKKNLSQKFEIASLTLNSKIPFKALSLREVLLHRFADQSAVAAFAMESRNPVSAATLTRGCMETLARIYEENVAIERCLKDKDLERLDGFLMNRMFGARDKGSEWEQASNILGAI
ncbi:MAG: hypothetical protein VYA25_11305, partial [Pseudomonadota bacterium]|nr:hypothetical protein [Pseudomonadota bacterium]